MRVLTALLFVVVLCYAAPMEHLITTLPGLVNSSGLKFRQFAGYVTVDQSHQRKLFYWFVESQRDPSKDPILLWLNGGPGASSFLGFFTEHGPFRVRSDGNIEPYPQTWNRVANILYLETPAGVGFSNSADKNDYNTDDQKVAADNYIFLQKWFQLFPEYSKNEFYLSGESYAGHYIPTLAQVILANDTNKTLNVRGILLGNPVTTQDLFMTFTPGENAWPYMSFLFNHALISQGSYETAFRECNFASYMPDCSANYSNKTEACWDAIINAIMEIPEPIDYYDIDAEVCEKDGVEGAINRLMYTAQWSGLTRLAIKKLKTKGKLMEKSSVGYEQNNRVDPCLENYMALYLNRDEVQKAIHADKTNWKSLTNLGYGSMVDDMVSIYQEIIDNPRTSSWRILIYSGDFDVVVPFLSTQRWIRCLGRPVVKPWHSWMIGKQVAGNVIEYDRISFLTIKGAGHMIPYYTPDKGYTFFQRWIDKEPFY